MANAIESKLSTVFGAHDRLKVRTFKTGDAMHRFLNQGDNALRWVESTKGLTAGTYAFAGGRWHNVKSLDAVTLAHI